MSLPCSAFSLLATYGVSDTQAILLLTGHDIQSYCYSIKIPSAAHNGALSLHFGDKSYCILRNHYEFGPRGRAILEDYGARISRYIVRNALRCRDVLLFHGRLGLLTSIACQRPVSSGKSRTDNEQLISTG